MSSNPTDPQPDSQTETASQADDLSAAQARIAELENDLAEARERADRYHSNWQRSAADFQNWKRRTDQEKSEIGRQAEGTITLDMVRVLDDFERAFQVLPTELRSLTWIEGVFMVWQKLYGLLQQRGLSPIEAAGEEFDPFLHEAVLREEGAEGVERLVVVQELQRGYRFHERVIRPTMVKVGPPPAAAATAQAEPTDEADPPANDATVLDAEVVASSQTDAPPETPGESR